MKVEIHKLIFNPKVNRFLKTRINNNSQRINTINGISTLIIDS